jgi:hypothetical protein
MIHLVAILAGLSAASPARADITRSFRCTTTDGDRPASLVGTYSYYRGDLTRGIHFQDSQRELIVETSRDDVSQYKLTDRELYLKFFFSGADTSGVIVDVKGQAGSTTFKGTLTGFIAQDHAWLKLGTPREARCFLAP